MNLFLELFFELCLIIIPFYIFKFTFHLIKLDKLCSSKLLDTINKHKIIYVLVVSFLGLLLRRTLEPITTYNLIPIENVNSSLPFSISLGLIIALSSILLPERTQK